MKEINKTETENESAGSSIAVHFTSNTDEWSTPQDLYDRLNAEWSFSLDPCSTHKNAKCARHYTKAEDGLMQDWGGNRVWMNPPYGREIGRWMRKAYEESQKGATVVCLVPARTDTAWWHDYAARGRVTYLRGRLKFGGHVNSAPFPSAIVVFGTRDKPEEIRKADTKPAALSLFAGAGDTSVTAQPGVVVPPLTDAAIQKHSRSSKTNTKKGVTMKTKTKTVEQDITDLEIAEIARKYVPKFNAAGEGNMQAQLELGRLVDEYVNKVTDGGHTRKDAFKILEEMPESVYKTSQLRNYRNAACLYNDLGGDSLFKGAALTLTHFIVLLPSRLTDAKKKEILLRAAAEHLTVAETKKIIPPPMTSRRIAPDGHAFDRHIHTFSKWMTDISSAVAEGERTVNGEEILKLENLRIQVGRGIEVFQASLTEKEALPLAA